MKKNIYVVLGLGFGDEGKGLSADFLSLQNPMPTNSPSKMLAPYLQIK